MSTPLRLLIIEDDPDDAELMLHSLKCNGVDLTWTRVETAAELESALETGAWDAVLSDYTLPEFGAAAAIEIVHAANPDLPVLVVSGTVGEEKAVETMRAGASDYVLKDNLVRLGPALDRELRAAENRQAKRAAEKLATHLAAIVESSVDAIVSENINGHLTSWNRGAEQLYGWTATEAIGRHATFLVPPDKSAERIAIIDRAWAGEQVGCFETVRLHRDGQRIDVSVTISPMRDALGRLVGLSKTGQDIRERKRTEKALRASETRYCRLFEAAQDGVLIVDAVSRHILDANPFIANLLGYCLEDLVGIELWEIGLFRDIEANKLAFRTLQEVGYVRYDDHPLLTRDGRQIDVEFVSNTYDVDGVRKIQCNIRDITAHKRAVHALAVSEERYRTLIAATTSIVWDTPASGEFETEQPGWTAFTGQTFDELRGTGWLNAIHPEDRQHTANVWKTACSKCIAYNVEHRLLRADGEYRHMAVRAVPIVEANGSIREWVGVHTDVTDQKHSEEELLLRDRAIQAATQGITITDPTQADNPLIYSSPGFERITGYKLQEVLGRNCRFLQGKDTDVAAVNQMKNAIRDGNKCTVELLNYRKDGAPFWNELSISPVRDISGRLTHFVGVQSDVTTRRALEEQFRQAQKMDAFGQLAGGVAHDFNNLITIINGYSDIVLRGLAPDDKLRCFVKEIIIAGERSAALTAQLLAFSRKQVVVLRILDLNTVVRDTEKMLRRIIGEDIELVTSLAEGTGVVRADSGQLEQVLLNLAVNARDAMPRGGKLTIETKNVELGNGYAKVHLGARPGSYVLLAASDTGCGMTEEVKKRIFEPFFTTKGVGEGTGLGLATVFGIVSQADGHVEVYSEVNIGTSFKIYLPRVNKAEKPGSHSDHLDAIPRGTESILLVEDEVGLRGLLQQVLNDCGYSVTTAASGIKAIQLTQEHPGSFDLIVTDVVMPGMSGRQMVEEFVARYPQVKVIYMSGYTDDAVVRHGILHDQVQYLQKPFLPAALARKVREVLDS